MRKRILCIATMAGLAVSASALIIDYQMDDPAGTPTSGLINNGTDTGNILGDVQGAATDGTGNLHYAGLTENSSKKNDLDVTYSSGSFQLTYRVAAWDYTGNDLTDGISFSLWDNTSGSGLKATLDYNAAGTRVRVAGSSGKQAVLNQFSGSDLIIRAIANLDAGTFSADYNLGGAGWTTIATDEVLGISSFNEFRIVTDGDPAWAAGAFVDVDYATMAAVPEPTTTALIGLAGVGLFLARNKRKTRAEKIIQEFERESES
jgi:hypothetical protein